MSKAELTEKITRPPRKQLEDHEKELIFSQVDEILKFPRTQEVTFNQVPQLRPVVLAGDWDPLAVSIAREKASQQSVDLFITHSLKNRSYSPELIVVPDEIVGLKGLMKEDTIDLIKIFNHTEFFIQDYTRQGLQVIKDSPSRIALMLRWGFEESRHQRLLTGGMEAAGIMDRIAIHNLTTGVFANGWDISQHGNLETKDFLYFPFGIDQETETVKNYRELWNRVTRDYEQIPLEEAAKLKITDPNQQRGFQRIIGTIYKDEAAHKAGYITMALMLFKFDPYTVLSLINEAHEDFVMPVINRVVKGSIKASRILYGDPASPKQPLTEVMKAVESSYNENFEALNKKIGLNNHDALITSIESAKSLVNGPRRFEVILPNGTFQEVAKAA